MKGRRWTKTVEEMKLLKIYKTDRMEKENRVKGKLRKERNEKGETCQNRKKNEVDIRIH